MPDFLRLLFENLILSQHFAVAARRFDGRTHRLRISIEEEGLCVSSRRSVRSHDYARSVGYSLVFNGRLRTDWFGAV